MRHRSGPRENVLSPQGRPVTLPAPDGADENVNTEGDFVLLWNFTKMESGRIY